ncbi:hypothetical protein [Acinetobacter sp. ANC 4558]|uniref:MrpH family fimbial adhesin n=1 Tax=Acinetobacter sp. ANC 4558 TaxID=1977876 RepID=UPI00111C17FB|nr:hypothetical protein [Acinetobacter sp. ANC 4558]
MQKFLYLLIGMIFSPLLFANAWTVSIPYSYWDPSKPWNQQFQYTAILYMTEDSFKSTEPLNRSCSESTPCYIQINTQQKGNPTRTFYPDPNIPRVKLTTEKTVGEALRAYFEKGTNYSYVYTVAASSAPDRTGEGVDWCGAMGISNSSGGSDYIVMAGGECANIAPPNVQCNLETQDVDLDYGQLNVSDIINGQTSVKDGRFKVYCNQDVNVMLSITSPDKDTTANNGYIGTKIRLKDDGSLVTYLTVDGKDISNPTSMPVQGGGTTFDVKSTLMGTGTTVVPGAFLSFAYVTISFE